jgi:2-keto-3-deoxy-L-rhamnonate aldolase RhmA
VSSLKERLGAGDLIAATWVKTPHPHVVEVLALSGLDALAIDAEHAPFDRAAIDLAVLASKTNAIPVLVRVPSASPEAILQALDSGADGIIAPHIRSAAEAEALVRHCHHGPGGRGFAGSSRSAGYTTLGMAGTLEAARKVTVVAQIEDVDAVDDAEAIAAVPGIDAIFIGRIDLTVSLGCESPDDPQVVAAVREICAACRKAGRAIGMFLSRPEDVPQWREEGVSLFILSSDQDFILKGARALAASIRAGETPALP